MSEKPEVFFAQYCLGIGFFVFLMLADSTMSWWSFFEYLIPLGFCVFGFYTFFDIGNAKHHRRRLRRRR